MGRQGMSLPNVEGMLWGKEKEKERVMNENPINPNNPLNQVGQAVRRSAGWSVAAGIAMVLVGLLAILAPAISGMFLTVLVGCVLIFCGLMHFVYAGDTHTGGAEMTATGVKTHRGSIWWEILVGMLYIAAGIYVLVHPMAALVTLTLALGIYLLLEAVLEFVLSYHFQGMRGSGWLLFHGIITIILAVIVFRTWPRSSVWLIGTLVGISIFISGIARLALALSFHRVARRLPG